MTRPAAGPSDIAEADALRDAVSSRSNTVADVINQLDAWGFTVNDTRFSLWSVLVVLLVLLGMFAFARLGSKLAARSFGHVTRLDPGQRLLGEKLVTIAVWALAIMVGIDLLGIDLTALAVFSGAFGLAIGFGLQKTFGNLIAGIILLMDRSIKPGDVISVADTAGNESYGQIRKIGLRAISVVTRDKMEYLIPNENLMINQVENWSYSSREVRVKAPVQVSYACDIVKVEELLLRATDEVPRVLASPAPRVLLMGFGESAVNFEIRFWISDPEEGMSNIRSDVLKRVWHLFKEHGIEIPFPQRDFHLKDSEALDRLADALKAGTPNRSGTS
ncbi:mechanosensitive ion channel family protein [Alteraurantiacibacter buctensis]|uniref:Mechanosensitive ion channel n=1 Tax=Alteraurantiacibacter buctensis TaxID=1503981 RepID=A0A844Z1G1_9SPHN|nr:mechanosensitive ion channel domain-containing protein [Alteraurantiacibacter buctensis]MXO72821.1 mechanosensitive ion channel [Alteraurantiacibacter buctensis]